MSVLREAVPRFFFMYRDNPLLRRSLYHRSLIDSEVFTFPT